MESSPRAKTSGRRQDQGGPATERALLCVVQSVGPLEKKNCKCISGAYNQQGQRGTSSIAAVVWPEEVSRDCGRDHNPRGPPKSPGRKRKDDDGAAILARRLMHAAAQCSRCGPASMSYKRYHGSLCNAVP